MPVRTNIRLKVGPVATTVSIDSARTAARSDDRTVCLGQPGHDTHAPTPHRQPYVCDHCGPIVDDTRTARARLIDGTWHLLDVEQHKKLTKKHAEQFLNPAFTPSPREQVDTALTPGDKMYFLQPVNGADAANYANIRSMVREHPELSFVSFFTPRSAAGVFTLEVRGDVLVLVERQRAADMKPLPAVDAEPDAFEDLCVQAVDGMVVDFDPEAYSDQRAALIAEAYAAAGVTADVALPARTGAPAVAASPANELEAELAALVAASKRETPARKAARKAVAAKKTAASRKRTTAKVA